MISASNFCSRIASITFPFVPTLPSSVEIYSSPAASNSSFKNVCALRYPTTICFFSHCICFASSRIGGTPIPPPIRKARFPSAFSTGKPFPSGPITGIVSPAFSLENSSVPVFAPVTRYTRRSRLFSRSISQRLIGRGSSLLPSLLYNDTNCPGFASFPMFSVWIHMLKIPSPISF